MNAMGLYVVACKRKPAIVLEALKGINHQVCWTTDYKLEPGWKPDPGYASMVQNQVGAMRCYRGHQDALKVFLESTNSHALILEDDAWPNRPDWVSIVASAYGLLNQFELVSLHGRAYRREDFTARPLPKSAPSIAEAATGSSGCSYLEPLVQGQVWVQGSLAYIVGREAAQRFVDSPYVGYPSDIYICNRFKFALIDPSPFNHDRRAGSLIDCKTPTD